MTRKVKLRCSKTRLLEDMRRRMMKFWRHFWHLVFVFPGFISFCFERLCQELFFLSSEGTLFDDYLYVPLQRTINRWNRGVWRVWGVGAWWQGSGLLWYRRWLFTTINSTTVICCGKTLPTPQEEALKQKQATACVRVSVRACMKYLTCNANIFFELLHKSFFA